MPNRNYIKGRAHEYDVKALLEQAGYTVTRASGSHGIFDLIAIRDIRSTIKEVWLLQLKVKQHDQRRPDRPQRKRRSHPRSSDHTPEPDAPNLPARSCPGITTFTGPENTGT